MSLASRPLGIKLQKGCSCAQGTFSGRAAENIGTRDPTKQVVPVLFVDPFVVVEPTVMPSVRMPSLRPTSPSCWRVSLTVGICLLHPSCVARSFDSRIRAASVPRSLDRMGGDGNLDEPSWRGMMALRGVPTRGGAVGGFSKEKEFAGSGWATERGVVARGGGIPGGGGPGGGCPSQTVLCGVFAGEPACRGGNDLRYSTAFCSSW